VTECNTTLGFPLRVLSRFLDSVRERPEPFGLRVALPCQVGLYTLPYTVRSILAYRWGRVVARSSAAWVPSFEALKQLFLPTVRREPYLHDGREDPLSRAVELACVDHLTMARLGTPRPLLDGHPPLSPASRESTYVAPFGVP